MATKSQILANRIVLYAIRNTGYDRLSTSDKRLIMQNKANLLDTQMNVSSVKTKDYENKLLCRRGENKPKQSQTNSKRSGDPLRVSFSESSNRGPNKANFKRNLAKVGHHEDYLSGLTRR